MKRALIDLARGAIYGTFLAAATVVIVCIVVAVPTP
jgi:hypothetical protein